MIKVIPSAGGWESINAAYEAAGNTGALTFYGIGSVGILGTLSLITATCLSEMGAPTFRMRIYTAKNAITARNAYIMAAGVCLLFSLIPSILGMSAFTIATQNGATAILANPDFAFSYVATQVLGPTLGLILLISGLSASMSSGDSDAISGVTILLEDILPILRKGKRIPEAKMKTASRIALLITLSCAFLVTLTVSDIMTYINNVLGSLMPGLVVTMIIGRLWSKRVTGEAGIASMVTGVVFGVSYLAIAPLGNIIDSTFGGPAIPAAIIVAIVCIAVTLCTKRNNLTEQEITDKVLEGRTDL